MVCPYSLTVPGGVQAQVLGLARALRQRGVDTRVLGPCDGPPPDVSVTPLGASMPTAVNGSLASIAPDVPASLRTIRALRDETFDVVHLHEPIVPGPTLTGLIFCDRPMVGTFHRAGGSGWYRATRPFVPWTVDHLSVRAAVSEQAARTASETVGGDLSTYEVLWNGIEVARHHNAVPAPTGGPTILFLGRIEPRKGLRTLVEAMAHLGPEVRLWVAGDGQQRAELQALTDGDRRIDWLGAPSDADKLRLLRGADVLCAPSIRGESFGVVLLEALASGTAVVASDLDGYRNVVRNGREGLLVPPGDPVALAGALRTSLGGGPSVRALVAAGEERARELGMDRLAERYLLLYERAIAAPRGRGLRGSGLRGSGLRGGGRRKGHRLRWPA